MKSHISNNSSNSITRRERGTAPGDTIQGGGCHPNESLNIFGGYIYKNTGQTITWKDEEDGR